MLFATFSLLTRRCVDLSSSREDPPRSGGGMIGSPFAPLAREHCPPTKGESSSQAKLFDNDRHFWYTCPSKSGLMTPPVPRGSRELTPVEAKGRANLNGNQGGQSPRKQEPTFVRTGNPVSVYGTGGCQLIPESGTCLIVTWLSNLQKALHPSAETRCIIFQRKDGEPCKIHA